MNRVIVLLGIFHKSSLQPTLNRIPDFGPVDIPNYAEFLEKSKEEFFTKWETLSTKEKEHRKLKDKNTYLKNFVKKKLIGSGSFGMVFLVKHKRDDKYYAMKAVLKQTVVELNQVTNTKNEKMILQCTNCPFHLRLEYFFKDNSYLYFVLPFIQGGELYHHLQQYTKFQEDSVRFYVAQVILALEYLHYLDIIYRDLKPENILLDHSGYIKLSDFGFCKCLKRNSERTYTFCGTMDYLAPEIILSDGYGKAVDWWAVGILAYELATGVAPFRDSDELNKFKKIVNTRFTFPDYMSVELKDLISQTLQKDLTKRFGNLKNGVNDFKKHAWFKTLNWQAVVCRKATPPIIPELEGPDDTRHFNELDYNPLVISNTPRYNKEFEDF